MSVSAIIPAYNESRTIGSILRVVKSVPLINEIIVVSDGSTDDTAEIARNYGTHVIEIAENTGKSGAVKAGLNECSYEIVILLDADLIGLKTDHIYDLLLPVLNDECDMTVGIFKHGRKVTDLAQKIAPKLSGQRALKKNILERMQDIDLTSYGFEIALTKLVNTEIYNVKEIYLHDVTHLTKEEKMGVLQGFSSRMKMYWDIIRIINKDIK
jgi:glycosyltransferase involved in cell wall biosynthesis